jgi:hypothetical protein
MDLLAGIQYNWGKKINAGTTLSPGRSLSIKGTGNTLSINTTSTQLRDAHKRGDFTGEDNKESKIEKG